MYELLGELDAPRRDGEAWKKVHRRYRQLLMEEGRQLRDENDRVVSKGLTLEEFEAEEARDFELPAPELLRCCAIECGTLWTGWHWAVLRLWSRYLRRIECGWEWSEPAVLWCRKRRWVGCVRCGTFEEGNKNDLRNNVWKRTTGLRKSAPSVWIPASISAPLVKPSPMMNDEPMNRRRCRLGSSLAIW
ncbi:MAG: hypothetical protein O3C21_08900 [Verrucomicrobia bacterium]|nr:hypothetical protein [Verrucomicrobiota bacterium]